MNRTADNTSTTTITGVESFIYLRTISVGIILPICLAYIFMLVLIVKNRSLHDSSNFFLANLYISDFLLSAAILVMSMLSCLATENRALTITALTMILEVTIGGYCFSSVIIAADRYYKITKPMRYMQRITNRLSVYIITMSWSLLIIFVIIWQVVTFAVAGFPDNSKDEVVNDLIRLNYMLFMIYVDILTIPCFVIMTYLCIGLVRIARAHKRRIDDEMRALANVRHYVRDDHALPHNYARSSNDSHGHQQDTAGPPIPRAFQKRKTDKNAVYFRIYFTSFIMCWLPFIIVNNIYACLRIPEPGVKFFDLIIPLSYSPLIHVLFGTLFLTYTQSEHRQVLCGVWRSFLAKFCSCCKNIGRH